MAITYIDGDILQLAKTGIIAHVVNDLGGWGRGFSGQLSKAYPRAEPSYRKWHKSPFFSLGFTHLESLTNHLLVAHMAAQHGYKTADHPQPLDYDHLRSCLESLTRTEDTTKVIHMPRIGAGLGGGDWGAIEDIINDVLSDRDVRVYTLPSKKETPTALAVVPQEEEKKPLVRQLPYCVIESPTKGKREYWDLASAMAAIAKAKAASNYLMIAASGARERDAERDYTAFEESVQKVCSYKPGQKLCIIQGGARGFDAVARSYAYTNNLPLITFPADWNGPDQRQAGIIRNTYVVDVADELIAAPGEGPGTRDAMRKARLRKVPVTQC